MKNEQNLIPPNHEYLELNYVAETATGKGNNTQFIMENLHDGTFQVLDGRVGITIGRFKPKKYTLSMDHWDEIYAQKVQRGYLLVKKEKMEKKVIKKNNMNLNGNSYKILDDVEVREIINRLLEYTNTVVENNYSVTVDNISDEMIAFGQKVLQELSEYENMSVAEFNNKLKTLYMAIPRRIDNLSKSLAKRKVEFNDIVAEEMELIDIMISALKNQQAASTDKTILDAFSLEWRTVTSEEEQEIKNLMGPDASRYLQAWRIENNNTRKNFEKYCEKENLSFEKQTIHKLFHGSRSENFWSIITNGLTVNPTGVVITGKMFGNGTYFANKARKSMGYTSVSGSRWAGGNCNTGFMAIYDVATGKCYDRYTAESDLNWSTLQQRCPGAHCTWAHAGQSLCNDEIIVYQNQQSTIRYLIEFKH